MNKEIESPFFDNVREIWDKGIRVLEFQYKKAVLGVDVSKTPKWLVPKWEVSNQKAFATNLQRLFEEIANNLDECNGLELDRYIFSLIIPFKGLADVLHNDNLARMGEESVNIWKPFNDWVFDMLQKADIYQSGNGIIEGCCMTLSNLYGVTYMYSNMLDAALLERGIDLLSIQKQVGITLLSRRDITQIGHYLGTPERAKTLINKVAPEPELQQPQPKESPEPQQKDLHYYCQKAIEKGYMIICNGGYKRATWSKAQLVYFLGHFLKPDGTFPDKEYCIMFGESRLSKALGQLINNKTGNGKPRGYEIVDNLLQE